MNSILNIKKRYLFMTFLSSGNQKATEEKDDLTFHIFAFFSTISRTCSKSPFFIPHTSSLIFVISY